MYSHIKLILIHCWKLMSHWEKHVLGMNRFSNGHWGGFYIKLFSLAES